MSLSFVCMGIDEYRGGRSAAPQTQQLDRSLGGPPACFRFLRIVVCAVFSRVAATTGSAKLLPQLRWMLCCIVCYAVADWNAGWLRFVFVVLVLVWSFLCLWRLAALQKGLSWRSPVFSLPFASRKNCAGGCRSMTATIIAEVHTQITHHAAVLYTSSSAAAAAAASDDC